MKQLIPIIFILTVSVTSFAKDKDFIEAITHLPKVEYRYSNILREVQSRFENYQDRVRDTWAKLRINVDIKPRIEIIDGVRVIPGYQYISEPSFRKGEFLRTDSWKLDMEIWGGELLDGLINIPLALDAEKNHKITFIRQFKSEKEARLSTPYHYKQIPTDSYTAIKNLNPGDFVVLPVNLNLHLGIAEDVVPWVIEGRVRLSYMLKGSFLLQFYRMEDDKIRLRIFATNGKGRNLDSRGRFDFDIFGINIIDRTAEQILNFKLWEAEGQALSGEVLLLDYIFDLKDPTARKAFDGLVRPKLVLNDFKMIKTIFGEEVVSEKLISDVAFIDKIAREDAHKDIKRIQRVFSAHNKYKLEQTNVNLNLFFLNLDNRSSDLESKLTVEGIDGNKRYYFVPVNSWRQRFSFDLKFIQWISNKRQSHFTLYETDENHQNMILSDIGITRDRRDIVYTKKEQKDLIQMLKLNLGEEVFNSIDWKNWRFKTPDKLVKRTDARSYFQYFFNMEGLELIKNYSLEDFQERVQQLRDTPIFPQTPRAKKTRRRHISLNVREMANCLYNIFSLRSILSQEERVKRIKQLREQYKFNKYGPLIMRTLLDNKDIDKYTFYHFSLFAENGDEIAFEWGVDDTSVFDQIRAFDNLINQDDENSLREIEGVD